jgi:hypothetical protein
MGVTISTKGRNPCLRFWIVSSQVHERANAAHPVGLLRARRKRPRGRRTTKKGDDERAPSHEVALARGAQSSTPVGRCASQRNIRAHVASGSNCDWASSIDVAYARVVGQESRPCLLPLRADFEGVSSHSLYMCATQHAVTRASRCSLTYRIPCRRCWPYSKPHFARQSLLPQFRFPNGDPKDPVRIWRRLVR